MNFEVLHGFWTVNYLVPDDAVFLNLAILSLKTETYFER